MPAIITPTAGISGSISPAGALHGEIVRRDVERHGTYSGPLEFDPADDEQIISAANLIVPEDIAIHAIPVYRPDVRDTTAEAADVASGKVFYGAGGLPLIGTNRGSYELIASQEFYVDAGSSTTKTDVGTIECDAAKLWTSGKIIYVRTRDKAGRRTTDCYYGTDAFYVNPYPYAGIAQNYMSFASIHFRNLSTGRLTDSGMGTSFYGVGVDRLQPDGVAHIARRYNGPYTGAMNGTYIVEIYALDWPDGISPFYA